MSQQFVPPSWHRQWSLIRTHRHWKIEEPGKQKKRKTSSVQSFTVPISSQSKTPESNNYDKDVQIFSNITIFDLFFNDLHFRKRFTGIVAPPWESLTRSLCVQLQHPDWMNLYSIKALSAKKSAPWWCCWSFPDPIPTKFLSLCR